MILAALALPPVAAADDAPRTEKPTTRPSAWSKPKRVISLPGGWIDWIGTNAKGQSILSGGVPWKIVFLRKDRSVAARLDAEDGAVQLLGGPDAKGGAYVQSGNDLIKLDANGRVVHQRRVSSAISLSENDRGDVGIVGKTNRRSVLENGAITDIGDVWFSFRPAGGQWGPDTILGQAAWDTAWAPQIHVDRHARTIVTWSRGQKLMVVRRPPGGPSSAPTAEGGNVGASGAGGLLVSTDGTDGMLFPEPGSNRALFGGYDATFHGPAPIAGSAANLAAPWMAPSGRTLLTWRDVGRRRFVAKFRPPHGEFGAGRVLASFNNYERSSSVARVSFDRKENGVISWFSDVGLQAAVVKRGGKFCRTETIARKAQDPHPVVDTARRVSIFYASGDAVYSRTRRAKLNARCKFARP